MERASGGVRVGRRGRTEAPVVGNSGGTLSLKGLLPLIILTLSYITSGAPSPWQFLGRMHVTPSSPSGETGRNRTLDPDPSEHCAAARVVPSFALHFYQR